MTEVQALREQAREAYRRQSWRQPPEHALVLADEDSPVFMAPAWEQMAAVWAMEERLRGAFRSGDGIGWHEQDPVLFDATEAFFRTAYRAGLVDEWIPALDGVGARLEAGGHVADVGCGHGAATILLAEAFPAARITGFDYHGASAEIARKRAADAGVDGDGRLRFELAAADEYPTPPGGYDLICFFDALHDFGDPVGAAVHARSALAEHGRVMLVEVRAGDRTEDNLNPLGRLGYGMSTFVCTPHALSQEGSWPWAGRPGGPRSARSWRRPGSARYVGSRRARSTRSSRPAPDRGAARRRPLDGAARDGGRPQGPRHLGCRRTGMPSRQSRRRRSPNGSAAAP